MRRLGGKLSHCGEVNDWNKLIIGIIKKLGKWEQLGIGVFELSVKF